MGRCFGRQFVNPFVFDGLISESLVLAERADATILTSRGVLLIEAELWARHFSCPSSQVGWEPKSRLVRETPN
jgi:hypothetical protein